jgi:hypothetical protein
MGKPKRKTSRLQNRGRGKGNGKTSVRRNRTKARTKSRTKSKTKSRTKSKTKSKTKSRRKTRKKTRTKARTKDRTKSEKNTRTKKLKGGGLGDELPSLQHEKSPPPRLPNQATGRPQEPTQPHRRPTDPLPPLPHEKSPLQRGPIGRSIKKAHDNTTPCREVITNFVSVDDTPELNSITYFSRKYDSYSVMSNLIEKLKSEKGSTYNARGDYVLTGALQGCNKGGLLLLVITDDGTDPNKPEINAFDVKKNDTLYYLDGSEHKYSTIRILIEQLSIKEVEFHCDGCDGLEGPAFTTKLKNPITLKPQ